MMDTALELSALCAAVTYVVEIIKAWVPAKNKDASGLIFARRSGAVLRIPNQAVWPVVSACVGIAVFMLVEYDPIGIGGYAGQAISGFTAGTAGGAGAFRLKNTAGRLLGGTDATSAQATGPSTARAETGPCNQLEPSQTLCLSQEKGPSCEG